MVAETIPRGKEKVARGLRRHGKHGGILRVDGFIQEWMR